MSSLWQTVSENVVFVLEFLALIVVMFLIAYVIEKAVKKKNSDTERVLATRKIVVIGVFSAIAAILMVLEFPVPFAPSFYGLDFSELPALIGAFAYGPVAGVMIEFCKILIKLVLKPSSTAFVGELANFSISCMLVLPASVIYLFKKSRKQAILGTVVGTLIMTAFGSCFNAIYLLPKGNGDQPGDPQHQRTGADVCCTVKPLKRRTGIADHYFGLQKAQPDLKGSA